MTKLAPPRGQKILNWAGGSLSFALLAGAVTTQWLESLVKGWPVSAELIEGLARGVLLLAASGIGATIFIVARRRLVQNEEAKPKPASQPSLPSLLKLRTAESHRLSEDDRELIAAFVDLVCNPERYRSRIAETVDLDGRSIRQLVTVEFDIPRVSDLQRISAGRVGPGPARPKAAQEAKTQVLEVQVPKAEAPGPNQFSDRATQFLYLPVLSPLKGELVDNFHLRDASGNSLADLTHEETTELASAGLRLLIADSVKSSDGPTDHDQIARVLGAELAMLQVIASRGRPAESVADDIDRMIGDLGNLNHDLDSARLRQYLTALSSSYPIVAVVRADCFVGTRVLLKYERTKTPRSHAKGFKGSIRLWLGLRPSEVRLPVDLALTGGSYHLRVNGPTNTYVFDRNLKCRHCDSFMMPGWKAPDVPRNDRCSHEPGSIDSDNRHFRVRRRRGQNFTHLYMRGYGRAKAKLTGLEMLVTFKELPPGTRARAVVTALMTTIVIWSITYMNAKGKQPNDNDLAALILVLPAIAASWFGLTTEAGSLVGSSLLSRVSLIGSGIVSLGSVVLFLTYSAHKTNDFTILGINDRYWMILFALSLVNLVYITYRYALKLIHYGVLLRKPDNPDTESSAD